MLGINATGRPKKTDMLLGRACIFLAELDSSGVPGPYRPVGNVPDLTVSVDTEELTHRSSFCKAFGGAVIDARIVIEQALNVSMTLEEISHDNVAVFFQALTETVANPAVAGIAEYALTTNLGLNVWYPIQTTAGVRVLTFDKSNLTVEDGTTGLTEGATGDYQVDEKSGMIIFYSGGPNTLSGGETINVTLAADGSAKASLERVLALKGPQKRYAIKALVENANNLDELAELEFHSVLLAGDGDFAPIGDELAQMTLSGTAEANQALTGTPTLTISKVID